MDALVERLIAQADLGVVLAIAILAFTLAALGLLATIFLRPKLKAVDEIQLLCQKLATIDSVMDLRGRVSAIEGAREAERSSLQEQLDNHKVAISIWLEQSHRLQDRTEREIARMLASKDLSWALEQAGQDVEAAEIAEQLARLNPAAHIAAQERLERARVRRDLLEAQRKQHEGL